MQYQVIFPVSDVEFAAHVCKRVCQEDNKHLVVFLYHVIKTTLQRSLLYNGYFAEAGL